MACDDTGYRLATADAPVVTMSCKSVTERVIDRVTHIRHEITRVAHTVCSWLPWPLDELCDTVVDVIDTVISWVEEIVRFVTRVVCVPVDLATKLIAAAVNLIESIPVFGALVRWVRGLVEFVVRQVAGLGEGILGLFGILPIKQLELHVVILSNQDGPLTTEAAIREVLRDTERIYRSRARVAVSSSVHVTQEPAPANALHIEAGVGLLGEDLTGAGSYFVQTMSDLLGDDAADLLLRNPAPLVAFVVEGVGDTETGCSAGPLADWVVVETRQMVHPAGEPLYNTLAHETGHACGLLHTDDVTNLMNPIGNTGRGDNLSPFQRMIVRSSSHVAF